MYLFRRISYLILAIFFVASGIFLAQKELNDVHAATLTLTPATGVPGMEVFITGASFDFNAVATITWDGVALTTLPSTVTTSGAGAIPANVSFVVPSAAIGAHTVRISTSAQVYITATFTITAPTVAISSPAVPVAGLPVGVPITITGSNFEGGKSTVVYFDDQVVATVTSTYNGAIEASFAIPDVNNTGAHVIKAVASSYSVANVTIIVAPPAIVLTPITGSIGLNVTVTGTNFKAGGLVSFFMNGAVLTADNPITANGAGSFAVTLSVPDVLPGVNTIKASSFAQLYATATFTAASPTIVLSPITGPVGLNVTITGTNFKSGSLVSFFMNGASLSTDSPVTANSAGTFAVTIAIPDVLPGVNTIKASSSSQLYATATYTVTSPALVLSPVTGPVGLNVTATGTNFKANSSVSFFMNGAVLATDSPVVANSAGTFAVVLTIPDTLQGVNTIKASSSTQLYATATYTVTTPAITLTPSGATTAPIVPGLPVNIFGTNFKANDSLTILVNGTVVVPQNAPVIVNNIGEFGCVIIFPQVSPGTSTIKVQSNEGYFAATSVTVSATSLTVNPASGPDSIIVHLAGNNLDANAPVSLYLDGNLQATTTTTNTVGFFSLQYTIPSGLQSGAHTIRAQTSDSSVANATFTVSLSSLTLSPATGSPGTVMNVSGLNFDVKKKVYFLWNGAKISPKEGTITTSSSGSFSANFIVPVSSPVGVNQLEATTGDISTAVSSFTIAAPTLVLSGVITANTAYSGSRITVSGTNFVGSREVQIVWDNDMKLVTVPKRIMTSSSGSFTASIVIPETRGFHSISMIADGQPVGSSVLISVGAPSTSISPTNAGTADSEITIVGSSYLAGTKVFIYWDNNVKDILASDIEILDNGSFTVTVKIPAKASPGYHTIITQRQGESTAVLTTSSFLVTVGELTASRENLNLGSTVTITGKQFNSSVPVKMLWDGAEVTLPADFTTDTIGGFSYDFHIPNSYPGKHTLQVTTSSYYTDSIELTIDEPIIQLQAQQSKIWDSVVLSGSGFMPNSEVVLTIGGRSFRLKGQKVMTDSSGSFKLSVKIPFIFSNELLITAKTNLYDLTSSNFEITNQFLWLIRFVFSLLLVYVIYRLVRFMQIKGYFRKMADGFQSFIQSTNRK